MTATSVSFFDPLAGAYSQNMPQPSQQFLNTGRRVIAGMNYLYDAVGGFEGLWAPQDGGSNQAHAFETGGGTFTPAYYPNFKIPGGVTNLAVQNNTISNNGGDGVTVNGSTSTGNALNGNRIFGNADGGIALTNGGNGGQPAPVINSAVLDRTSLTVTGSVKRVGDYKGPFQVQVYANPAADAGNVQGRRLLGTVDVTTTDFTAQFPSSATIRGSFITVVATPATGPANTSGFSAPATVL
jgi:hypothetical protein